MVSWRLDWPISRKLGRNRPDLPLSVVFEMHEPRDFSRGSAFLRISERDGQRADYPERVPAQRAISAPEARHDGSVPALLRYR